MSERGCSAGCLTVVGAFFVFTGFNALGQGGGVPLLLFFLVLGGVPLWLAGSMFRADKQAAQRRAEQAAGRNERVVLQVAAANGGRVTPAMVALESAELTVAKARKLLEQLERDGFCSSDVDQRGGLVFVFPVGRRETGDELSADDWVDLMTSRRGAGRRMSGSADAAPSDVVDTEN